MRTRVRVVAEAAPGGRTRLTSLHADGQLAVRATPSGDHLAARVHLVGAAAGPMGGDEVHVDLVVGPAAHLEVRSAAAALALPGRTAGARAHVVTSVQVADGGRLDLACEPTVVCRRAVLTTGLRVTAAPGARVDAREAVVLGRHGETPGTWRGEVRADVAGVPALRSSVSGDLMADRGARAVVTVLRLGPDRPPADPSDDRRGAVHQGGTWAVVTRLAVGGRSATAWGASLDEAEDALARLHPAPAVRAGP